MKGFLIDVIKHEVASVALPEAPCDLLDAIREVIGCRVLALGAVLPNADVLYVNQLGLLETEWYFKHALVPVPIPDHAVLLGSDPITGEPCSVRSGLSATAASIQYLDKWDTIEWALSQGPERKVSKAA